MPANDSLYQVTPAQLRTTVNIFKERDYLKIQNELLIDQISLYERSGRAKDIIINSKESQINVLNNIIDNDNKIIANNNAVIQNLKLNIESEQKDHKKYLFLGCGVGAAIASILFVILK